MLKLLLSKFLFAQKIAGIIFQVWLGPNAVLAFKREGYSWFDVSFKDLLDVLRYPGFYKLASKYLRYGSSEMIRSIMISLSGKVTWVVILHSKLFLQFFFSPSFLFKLHNIL